MKKLLAFVFLFVSAPALAQDASDKSGENDRQTVKSFEVKLKLNYLLYLPKDYEPAPKAKGKKWPLLVFLHGAGERGSDINLVKRYGPPRIVTKKDDFPFVMISPQCPNGSFWNTGHLLQLIKSTINDHNIDPDRVYLTGLSMGGFGSFALAAEAPDLFAAVAPVCGGGDPRTAEKLKDLPIWVFHGDADRVVPIASSQRIVDAIKKAGGEKVKFTIYEGVRHDSWTKAYATEELYTWFLKQKRISK